MARIPESEIERLKREISVQRLAEARGMKLKRHGADLIGLCPFHDDHEPSLVITPEKNLWHCLGACRARRNRDRLGHAGRRRQLPPCGRTAARRPAAGELQHAARCRKRSTVPKLPAPVERRCRRSHVAVAGGELLPGESEAESRSAAVSGASRPEIGGDDRALPAGLCQSHARLSFAGIEPL